MKALILSISFVLYSLLNPLSYALDRTDLQTGDVVLLSLNCFECRMIESETESAYSHSGVIIVDEFGEIRVAQSLGRVDHVTYSVFTKNITPKTTVSVFRPREFTNLKTFQIKNLENNMLYVFNTQFKGAPFDSKYEWNNFNPQGIELLYCSEFIAKFLDYFLTQKTILGPISYSKHYDYWLNYFKGYIPENVFGNSPASFSRDERFIYLGQIY